MILTVVLGMSFIGIPLAFLTWIVGAYPFEQTWKNRYIQKWTYDNRDRPLEGEDADVPWEV